MRKEATGNLSFVPEGAALLLTLMLPLKFGSISGIPEVPSTYLANWEWILFGIWPVPLFPLFALGLLVCALGFAWPGRNAVPWLRTFLFAWAALAFVSIFGFVNASCWDFAIHGVGYSFGVASYAVAICLIVERRPAVMKWLLMALAFGLLMSSFSAINQYFTGFDVAKQFAYEQEAKAGIKIMQGQFESRLNERRIYADFTSCNNYAGYLILAFPVLLGLFWRFGEEVEPPWGARLMLMLPAGGLFAFLLWGTHSRAAFLAFAVAIAALLFVLPFKRALKTCALSSLPVFGAVFAWMVASGRGFGSMMFRFDYFWAALRMLLARPLCGTGWGDFFHEYTRLKLLSNDEAPHNSHNFMLDFGSQCGVLGLAVSLAILAIPIVVGIIALRRRLKTEKLESLGLDIGLLLGCLAWSLHSLSEGNFQVPASVCLATVVAVAILVRASGTSKEAVPAHRWSLRVPTVALCVLLAAGTAWYGRELIRYDMASSSLHSLCDVRFMSKEEREAVTPEQVVAALMRCKDVSPKAAMPWAEASDYMTREGFLGDASIMLGEVLRLSPERAGFHFRKYRILILAPERREEALGHLRKALELFPGNPEYKDAAKRECILNDLKDGKR